MTEAHSEGEANMAYAHLSPVDRQLHREQL